MYKIALLCIRSWTGDTLAFQRQHTYEFSTVDFEHFLYETQSGLKPLPDELLQNMTYWFDLSDEDRNKLIAELPYLLCSNLNDAFPVPVFHRSVCPRYLFPVLCTRCYEENNDEYWSEGRTYLADTMDFENFNLTTNFSDRFDGSVGKNYMLSNTEDFFAIDEETRTCLKAELSPKDFRKLTLCFGQ